MSIAVYKDTPPNEENPFAANINKSALLLVGDTLNMEVISYG